MKILIAEDDLGHAELIMEQMNEAGIKNPIQHFINGQAVIDFLFSQDGSVHEGQEYLLLLDIHMPLLDGVEVLERIKSDLIMRSMPVIMLTTTDDPREVERCYALGCNSYVTKPVEFKAFSATLKSLGLFLAVMSVPEVRSHA